VVYNPKRMRIPHTFLTGYSPSPKLIT